MGVFPLADTMSFFSNPPLSGGGHWHAAINGWTDEVWWYPRPTTTPRRNAAAVHPSIHYIATPLALTRGPATGSTPERGPPSATSRMPSSTATACTRHSSPVAAPAVLAFAAGGTRLQ
jgi:hypothetical protein